MQPASAGVQNVGLYLAQTAAPRLTMTALQARELARRAWSGPEAGHGEKPGSLASEQQASAAARSQSAQVRRYEDHHMFLWTTPALSAWLAAQAAWCTMT